MALNNPEQDREMLAVTERLARVRNILLVLSGKGGVGKSTVAVNIAAALAREGKSVGLLDIDIHGPSVPGMMALDGEPVLSHEDAMLPVEYTPNLKVMSVGFLLKARGDAVIWRGPMKYGVIKQFLGNVEWGDLDYLVVDSPPGTGDEPLSVAQMAGNRAVAVVVTTPQRVSVDDVRRSIGFCRSLEIGVAGIVENMSGLVCPHCGETIPVFDTGGGKALAEEMGVPFLGGIPLDPSVVRSGDRGRPVVLESGDSPAAAAFRAVVEHIQSYFNTQEG